MPSATQMAAAKHCPWVTAATEHSPEVPLLQSTEMSANVVFINTGKTIANVVQNMNPTMICMCEVGEATIPLTQEQMQQVSHESMHAWKEAATQSTSKELLQSTVAQVMSRST